jgi:peptidoglycan hydrolase-like protein with peptidoglycan-binding domain
MNSELTFEAEPFELSLKTDCGAGCKCSECREHSGLVGQTFEDPELWADLNDGRSEQWQLGIKDDFEQETGSPALELGDRQTLTLKRSPMALLPIRQFLARQVSPGLTFEKTCWVQNVLNRVAGERLAVDGKAGPELHAAVQRFQSVNRLKMDGIVGPPTETALIQAALNKIAKQSLVPVNGVTDARTEKAIRLFQSAHRLTVDGRVGAITRSAMIRALGGRICSAPTFPKSTAVGGGAPPPPFRSDGHKYTDNPNEVVTKRTTPAPQEVVEMLKTEWPALSENGARTLTAQFMGETGGGKYCFNWNLGNVKEPSGRLPHMYLRNVWEVVSQGAAEAQVQAAGGLARIASDAEAKKHGWSHPVGMAVVVFSPPHAACRFRAYANLRDGAQRWLGHHHRIAVQNPSYLDSVNAGDTGAVAHALKMARYYTLAEADYAKLLAREKAEIDRVLGGI